MEGLVELLGLQMHNVEADVAASLESLLALINEQVKQSFDYRCDYCGFEARSLFWFCPCVPVISHFKTTKVCWRLPQRSTGFVAVFRGL